MPTLRTLSGPALAVALTALGWLRWRTPWSLGLLLFTTTLLALALFAPRAFAPIQAMLERFGHAVATALTILLLGLLFVVIFVPGRLLLALRRRDPLHRLPEAGRTSYWQPLPPTGEADRFSRQY